MTNKTDKPNESKSNPEKSFEAGKKGGKPSTEITGQASDVLKGSKIVNRTGGQSSGDDRNDQSQQDKGR
ncbi:hypothetical protein [Pontibacter roseus]|uniref:hypothetical protein n=1 Tax=Pontibacter roseus TaxID=336989 RepID=UPI00037C9FFE|nr:hypothetical protein [Pontibacter roseus]